MSPNLREMPNDIAELCRVCLQLPEDSQYLDLSTIYDEEENLTYGECFTICTQIDLNAGEDVPRHLCKSCGLELQMCYDFYKKVEESKRVIERCQRQTKVHKENAIELLPSSEQPKTPNLKVVEERPMSHIMDEKYIIIDDDGEQQMPEETQDCSISQQENEQRFVETSNMNDEADEMDILNICHAEDKILQVPSHENGSSTSIEVINEENNVSIEVEDHLQIEDYQNLEALEDEDLPSVMIEKDFIKSEFNFEQGIVTNATITPCIPTGVRLPIPPGPPFICEFCGHSSNTKNLLASHRHRKHRRKESPYQCYKCGRLFNCKEAYEKHMNRLSCQHYPEFTCEYCTKRIIGSANYKIHLRFHKKIYPFECQECGKGFMMAIHLKTHVQTKHENKRYICEEPNCGKLFQSHQSLKSHMYVHLGSMPYCCEYCEKMFPNKGRLRWHLRSVHDFEVSFQDLDRMLVAEEITLKAKVKPI